MNYLYLPTCVNATSVSVCQTEFIYISQVDACIQIHDTCINKVKLIIIMKLL